MSLSKVLDKRIDARLRNTLGQDLASLAEIIQSMDSVTGTVQGPPGPPGPPGKSLHTGLGPPSAAIGSPKDTYVDVNTGNVFVKG